MDVKVRRRRRARNCPTQCRVGLRAARRTTDPADAGWIFPLSDATRHDDALRSHSHRRPRPRQPHRHGAADAQPRRPRGGAVGPRGRVLPAARERRADHHRGVAGLPRGPGLHRHARHPQRPAGRRLAARHRRRACRGRAHRRPALARGARLARLAAAERPVAGVVDRAASGHQDLHPRRLRPGVDAPGARHRRDPRPSSRATATRRGTRWTPDSTASRCTARTAT